MRQARLLLTSLVGALLFLLAHGEICLLWLPDSALRDWLWILLFKQSPLLGWGLR